jgi:hypothetical protein
MRRLRLFAIALTILVISLWIRSWLAYDTLSLGRFGSRTYSFASAGGGLFVMATHNSSRGLGLDSCPMTGSIAQFFAPDRPYIPVAIGARPGFT